MINTGYDSWLCVDTSKTCQTFEYTLTVKPTSKPTEMPTRDQTIHPTVDPTISPSLNTGPPTMIPTISPTRDPTMPPTRDPTPSPITSSGQNPVTISPTPVTALLLNPTLNPFAEREVKQISTTPMSITVFKTPTAKKDDSFVVVVCIVSGEICCAISGIVCYGRYKVKRDVPGEQSQRSSSFIGSAIDKTNINAQSQNANRVDNAMGKSNYVDIELSVKQQPT
eukprot:1156855_1